METPPGWCRWKLCLDHCWITMTVGLALRKLRRFRFKVFPLHTALSLPDFSVFSDVSHHMSMDFLTANFVSVSLASARSLLRLRVRYCKVISCRPSRHRGQSDCWSQAKRVTIIGILVDKDDLINYQLLIIYQLLIRTFTYQPTVDKTIVLSTNCWYWRVCWW